MPKRIIYRDEENPYDYVVQSSTKTEFRDEEKLPESTVNKVVEAGVLPTNNADILGGIVQARFGENIMGGGSGENQVNNNGYVSDVKARRIIAPSNFTAGEALSLGDALYFKALDSKVYKTDTDADESTYNFIGFAKASYDNGTTTVQVITGGIVEKTAWGLTAGTWYYLSATGGAVNSTPAARALEVGIALSATELLIIQRKPRRYSGSVTLIGTATSTITCGFYPTVVYIFMQSTNNAAWSNGFGDPVNNQCVYSNGTGAGRNTSNAWINETHSGIVDTFSSTGFRLNQTGTGANYTLNLIYLALG